uniref:Uncharacterized protein n=1 Tax=Anguilla anguilla TaxID=7936 RepID=A0A0E9QTU0_ANGAN
MSQTVFNSIQPPKKQFNFYNMLDCMYYL